MRLKRIREDLKFNDWQSYKKKKGNRDTEKRYVRTEAEIGAVQLQAKECQEKLEEGRKDSSLELSEGA